MKFPAKCVWMLLVLAPLGVLGQEDTDAQRFVQGFYDWYVQTALKDPHGLSTQLVLKQKQGDFERQLAGALEKDKAAQVKSPGYIVGLDFDPFLASQDPCKRYEAGVVRSEGSGYLVPVYSVCDGRKSQAPDVIAEVAQTSGRWVFLDFRYPRFAKDPTNVDLLSVLRRLNEERSQQAK